MKEILKGLEMFKSNLDFDTTDIHLFENYYNIEIPPLYKIFIQQFKVGRGMIKKVELLHPGSNKLLDIAQLVFKGKFSEYIGLYDLYNIHESVEAMKYSFDKKDEIRSMNYAIIGECIDNNSLLVGTGKDNLDNIFLENTNLFFDNNRIVFVSPNIFEFVINLALTEREYIGYGLDNYSTLYKNWNEEFWRVHE